MKIAFFDTKEYDKESFNLANESYGYDLHYFSDKLTPDNAYLTKGSDVVCVFVNDKIGKETLVQLKENGVKMIALRCAGFNNVDIKVAEALGIIVTNVPRYSPEGIAEHTLALMLSLNRKIHKAYLRTKDYNFALRGLKGFNMQSKTVGIVGLGAIGRSVARLLTAFGCNVLGYDPKPNEQAIKPLGITLTDLDTIWRESDIITLHCPLTPTTKHIVSKDSIKKMKDGVMLINTSRGGLVDARALIDGILSRKIANVGLDVYEEETNYFFEDHTDQIIDDVILLELLAFPNVLVTSHQAFFTQEALEEIASTTLQNIAEYIRNIDLTNQVTEKKAG